ncbi:MULTISPECIES: hypothetical protein [Streptomyces]|uniref:DUF4383 domain-containing protein n=1 Tax=Streptomyces evansiae TaxID=3075535 RepID=A0ABD5E5E5_9ACTN|nr:MULTISPECIES: hypothetical protein [unclassified Streptomyces]ASY36366.1 hypothetical protein CAC01_29755 [Streptomyces sp. CLI2509]MDT0409122.1 hypothetical protein [Streptomyces sp. DSM 41979]MDT0415515.1 hypothetical protein [Streptomyces sp. DSM 41982]MDT0424227.1 hypothetical protein [Streptomyces sp. DSM 41859]MYQ59044.1 hypothetical protein [Streptomyces sp. SID4926]
MRRGLLWGVLLACAAANLVLGVAFERGPLEVALHVLSGTGALLALLGLVLARDRGNPGSEEGGRGVTRR